MSVQWEQNFAALIQYKEKHGDCLVTTTAKRHDNEADRKLGRWVDWVRKNRYRLTPVQLAQLKRVEFSFDPTNDRNDKIWLEKYKRLKRYRKFHGDCCVPSSYPEDPELGVWVKKQRYEYHRNLLSQERIEKLESLHFVWRLQAAPYYPDHGLHDSTWMSHYQKLMQFKNRHGHCIVPKEYEEQPQLGSWVSRQRQQYKNGLLRQDRVQLLEEISFTWEVTADIGRKVAVATATAAAAASRQEKRVYPPPPRRASSSRPKIDTNNVRLNKDGRISREEHKNSIEEDADGLSFSHDEHSSMSSSGGGKENKTKKMNRKAVNGISSMEQQRVPRKKSSSAFSRALPVPTTRTETIKPFYVHGPPEVARSPPPGIDAPRPDEIASNTYAAAAAGFAADECEDDNDDAPSPPAEEVRDAYEALTPILLKLCKKLNSSKNGQERLAKCEKVLNRLVAREEEKAEDEATLPPAAKRRRTL